MSHTVEYTAQRSQPSRQAMSALVFPKAAKDMSGHIEQIICLVEMPCELVWGNWRVPDADNDPVFKPMPSFA